MEHDIINIERTGRWVCKCGASGYLKSQLAVHKQEIEDEKLMDDIEKRQNEGVQK